MLGKRYKARKTKLVQAQVEICAKTPVHCLFIRDNNNGFKCLVDTGANPILVLPVNGRKFYNGECEEYKLYAANGIEIKTYGEKTLNLDFSLGRSYRWTFVFADVKQSIVI